MLETWLRESRVRSIKDVIALDVRGRAGFAASETFDKLK